MPGWTEKQTPTPFCISAEKYYNESNALFGVFAGDKTIVFIMKSFTRLLLPLATMLAIGMFFSACSSDDKDENKGKNEVSIVGT